MGQLSATGGTGMLQGSGLAEEVLSDGPAIRAGHGFSTKHLNLLVDAKADLFIGDHLALGARDGFGGTFRRGGRLAGGQGCHGCQSEECGDK